MNRFAALAAALGMTASAAATAKDRPIPPSPLLRALSDCRAIGDDTARLRCFDDAAAKIASAVDSQRVFLVDKSEIEKDKREQFGSRGPKLGLPGTGAGGDEIDQIDGIVRAARVLGDGNWSVTLEDGSVWHQTDGISMGHEPRKGDKVVVLRASFGSYKMRVTGQAAIRVKRVA